jgi:hypothetical protein
MNIGFRPEKFTQHRGITRIFEFAIEVIFHKIEKGGQVGKTNPYCVLNGLGDIPVIFRLKRMASDLFNVSLSPDIW